MVVPRISASTRYILSQLDEIERDDNFRLKRFKALKTKKKQKDSADTVEAEKESKTTILDELVDLEIKGVDEDSKALRKVQIDEMCSCYSQNFITGEDEEVRPLEEPVADEHYKNHVQDIMSHADEIINLSTRNDTCHSKVIVINDELQAILDKLLMARLCEYCKRGTQVEDVKDTHRSHGSHGSDNNLSDSSGLGSELSIPESIFKMKSEEKQKLGHFKRKYKESIEVLRLQNEDGTIRQKKKKIIVKTDTRNPIKPKRLDTCAKKNSPCPCYDFDSESEDSSEEFENPKRRTRYRENYKKCIHCNTKSGPDFSSSVRSNNTVRHSVSSELKCLCSDENLQSSSAEKSQHISINRIPIIFGTSAIAGAKEATSNTDLTKIVNLCYIFKNVVNAMNDLNSSYVAYKKSCSDFPKFAYIFSKVNKLRDDTGFQRNSCDICYDIPSTNSYTKLYSRNCRCYKRTEIESLIRNACSYVVNFPYLFSRCISKESVKQVAKLEDAATCCCPGDITVNLTFQGKNSGILQIIKVSELPIASSVNVNFFCSPKNICQEPTDRYFNYIDSNGIIQKKLDNDFQMAPNQIRASEETTRACTLNLGPTTTLENFFDKSNRASNEEEATVQATKVCAPCKSGGINYTLADTNQMPTYDNKQISTTLKSPEFAYIFSKTSEENDEAKDSSKTINILFKGIYNNCAKYPYIFSSYQRVEIENLLKNACSKVVSFPYLFTKIVNKRESYQNNLKLSVIKYEGCGKKYLTGVDNKFEYRKSNDLLREESKNTKPTERCCRIISNTKYNLNCAFDKNEKNNHLSYIFSKVKQSRLLYECSSSKHVIENECLRSKSKDKSVISSHVLFSNSKGDHKNIQNMSNLHYVKENIDERRYGTSNFPYIFSKLSRSKSSNNPFRDYGFDVSFKDICVQKHHYPYIFDKLEHKNSDYIRRQEIEKYFKECCKRRSINDFEYILEKVEIKNQDNFGYMFSKVKYLSKTLKKKKYPSEGNIDGNELKYDCVSYGATTFPYIFNKVKNVSPPVCTKYRIDTDDTFKATSKSINDFPNKNRQTCFCKEIAKLFKDSCNNDIDVQEKYEYMFKKVSNNNLTENYNGNSKCTKIQIQRPKLSCSSFIDYSTKSLSIISNQSHRFVVKLLTYKSGSSCIGIELMLRTDRIRDKNQKIILKNPTASSKSLVSPKTCSFDTPNTRGVKIVKSNTFHDKENFRQDSAQICAEEISLKDEINFSSITRLLDTAKNAFVPLGSATTSQETDKYLSLMDNLKSILSNTTVSSYSWKSCVMKTCQAEMENIEKNISYSTFSFESSSDYVSCKSEDGVTDSNWNSKVIGINLNRDPLSFNVEMTLDGSIYSVYSRISTSEEKITTAIFESSSSSLYNRVSVSDVLSKEISEIRYSNVMDLLDRSNRYFSLKEQRSNSCCSYIEQFYKSIRQSHIEYYCDICKQRYTGTIDECFKNPTPCSSDRSIPKFPWLPRDKCSSFKKSQ